MCIDASVGLPAHLAQQCQVVCVDAPACSTAQHVDASRKRKQAAVGGPPFVLPALQVGVIHSHAAQARPTPGSLPFELPALQVGVVHNHAAQARPQGAAEGLEIGVVVLGQHGRVKHCGLLGEAGQQRELSSDTQKLAVRSLARVQQRTDTWGIFNAAAGCAACGSSPPQPTCRIGRPA